MSTKCSHKDIVFLGDSQGSNEQANFNHKLFQHKDLSSNDIKCMDPYVNLFDELNHDVIFPGSGQKNKESSNSNLELVFEEKGLQIF
jgi:hypothetical protein